MHGEITEHRSDSGFHNFWTCCKNRYFEQLFPMRIRVELAWFPRYWRETTGNTEKLQRTLLIALRL